MANREIATVRWGSLNSHASLYGTALTLESSGDVRLVNPLMPSGTTIQEWYSFTDYQAVRDAPALPLLHPGKTYRIDLAVESSPPGAIIVDVRYFDRFNALMRSDVLHPPSYSFEYPTGCHHYTVRLVNGGCDELRFTSFTMMEADGHA